MSPGDNTATFPAFPPQHCGFHLNNQVKLPALVGLCCFGHGGFQTCAVYLKANVGIIWCLGTVDDSSKFTQQNPSPTVTGAAVEERVNKELRERFDRARDGCLTECSDNGIPVFLIQMADH